MARAATRQVSSVAIWGAGTPLSTAMAEGLREHGLEATCIAGLRRRPGAAHRTVVFPLWDGRAPEEPSARRGRLLEETRLLVTALAEGRFARLIVISCSGAYGSGAGVGGGAGVPAELEESAPLAAAEGDTPAADAVAVEALLGTDGSDPARQPLPGVCVLRPALLLGPGCETALLARHLAGPRLLLVRGSAPRWQVCHVDDLCGALALLLTNGLPALPRPAVVASGDILDQSALEAASGRRRLELPARVAEATAARLRRTRLSPAAPDELPMLTRPVVVAATTLSGLGFTPRFTAGDAVRSHLRLADAAAEPAGKQVGQAATLAGATVAVVGSAALLRRARRARGLGG